MDQEEGVDLLLKSNDPTPEGGEKLGLETGIGSWDLENRIPRRKLCI